MEALPKAPPAAATFRFVRRETGEQLTIGGIVWQTDDGGLHFQLDQLVPSWCMDESQAQSSISVSVD